MADIDATDNHMGRPAVAIEEPEPHSFVGSVTTRSCEQCGMLRIHSNHHTPIEPHLFTLGASGRDGDYCATCGALPDKPVHVKSALVKGTPSETLPDVPYEPMTATDVEEVPETIADEASRIVYGDREKAYDDPNVNFEKIALMWNGLWLRKLKPDARITPEEVALAFVLSKVSRESHKPQRDNRVDMIGYTLCGDRIVQKREREAAAELEMMDGYNAAE